MLIFITAGGLVVDLEGNERNRMRGNFFIGDYNIKLVNNSLGFIEKSLASRSKDEYILGRVEKWP